MSDRRILTFLGWIETETSVKPLKKSKYGEVEKNEYSK